MPRESLQKNEQTNEVHKNEQEKMNKKCQNDEIKMDELESNA